ncbi:MAG: SPOR domain-containing protein [Campylobacteraceae bacterium]|jgi:DedD protein|nr:SPOR domain-containing protein [Campylobacteraceae bacterium]MBT3882278.1 SPOR domain-containing protein [Campylobacteraceae bacterium]MBT4030316.1 SPOR domain-containing protein [Campylobacteraceae bacterium]MBT4179168.1 SPOR domain-containing protein [Campylobacteraceae bacterium]MBT4572364.1 SPOR domain-containing protein [Campylobacteraceae bacterium]
MEFKTEAFFQDELNKTQNNHDEEGLDNISLNDSIENKTDKKKYILLGLALLTVFIITIVVVNFMSNVNDDSSNLLENDSIAQDNILENINPEQKYKEIIEKRAEILKQDEKITYTESVKSQEPVSSTNELKEIKKEKAVSKEVVIKKQKELTKLPVPTEVAISNLNKLNGSFIQLGAFSKYPSKAYLNNIQSKGYAVKIHKVEINGKFYHKLLIGPYKTQKESRSNLSKIRKDLKSPKAFIYQ